jgi:hypothetical protein
MPDSRIIYIQAEAPPKPALGAACNGCGLCCLLEPCPLGILVSRRRRGACAALIWHEEAQRYQCGMIKAPGRFVPLSGPRMAGWVARLARHLISAGQGCDAELRAETPPAPRHQAPEDGR